MTEPVSSAASSPLPARAAPLFGLAAVIVCLGFAAVTGHMWEDYFITFRASLNLAGGHGLVFQAGERVHSFTSPLGTLLPALFALGGGEDVAIRALWGLRLVSAAALGGALWIALRAFREHGVARAAATAAGAAWVLDPKSVDFAINGMETALVVLFVVFTWRAFTSGARLWPCALGFAGLQWTRPDGCVYFAAVAGAWLILGAAPAGFTWRRRLAAVAAPVAVGALLYLPWVAWAWHYYGSPVPHTILAKVQTRTPAELGTELVLYPWRLLFGHTALHDLFQPAYFYFGGWPGMLRWISRIISVGAALAWVWPRVPTAGRVASGAFFIGGFYVAYIPPSPWYYPGWQALAWLTWGYLLHALWSTRPNSSLAAGARIAGVLLVAVQAALFIGVTWQMRAQQHLIEDGNRTAIGRWLRATAAPNDSVFLECLGYIGYYSGLKMLDYPGLCAPEVVAARRDGNRRWADIIAVLRPTWLVMRPHEATQTFADRPELYGRYELQRTFDASPAINALTFVPGRGYLEFDATFLVYHRTGAEERAR